MKRSGLCVAVMFALSPSIDAAAQTRSKVDVSSDSTLRVSVPFDVPISARYRLHPTRNAWNFIQIDTATGRLWQVQYSIDESPAVRFVLSSPDLSGGGSEPGRFALYETANVWNFLMIDQKDGRVWQVQFTLDDPNLAGISLLEPARMAPSREQSPDKSQN